MCYSANMYYVPACIMFLYGLFFSVINILGVMSRAIEFIVTGLFFLYNISCKDLYICSILCILELQLAWHA